MSRPDEHLWTATQLILGVIDADDFALAGSGAIRQHGITDRHTKDVDLFTTNRPAEAFSPELAQISPLGRWWILARMVRISSGMGCSAVICWVPVLMVTCR